MPAPHDDDLLWDEPKKAERVAPKRTGFRPKGYDVVADVVDDASWTPVAPETCSC